MNHNHFFSDDVEPTIGFWLDDDNREAYLESHEPEEDEDDWTDEEMDVQR
jgi:hypothetical protein